MLPWLKNQSEAENESSIEQVEVPQRERPPPVDEPDQEDGAEREPDPGAVDLRAAERARVPARHPPRDLRAGPGGEDGAASRRRPCPPRSRPPCPTRLHRPAAVLRVVRLLVRGPLAGSASSQSATFAVRREERERPLLREARRVAVGTNGVWTRRPFPLKTGAVGVPAAAAVAAGTSANATARTAIGRRGTAEARPQRYAGRRNDQSLFPRKFSGVTRTIAIAWAMSLPTPSMIRTLSTTRFAPSEAERDEEEAHPLGGDAGAAVAERPEAVPGVVARHGDEERARRRDEIVEADVEKPVVDREVDEVADSRRRCRTSRAAPSSGGRAAPPRGAVDDQAAARPRAWRRGAPSDPEGTWGNR